MQRLVSILAMLWLCQCATPVRQHFMEPAEIDFINSIPGTVMVEVAGGERTRQLSFVGKISSHDFASAVEDSILDYEVFDDIEEDDPDYKLEIFLDQSSSHHRSPLDTTEVELATIWTLARHDGTVVWSQEFHSEHHVSATQNLLFPVRVRLANEGASRESIKDGLEALSMLTTEQLASKTSVQTVEWVDVEEEDENETNETYLVDGETKSESVEDEIEEQLKVVRLHYGQESRKGFLVVSSSQMNIRSAIIDRIGKLCSSKNITNVAGQESDSDGHYRTLNESLKNEQYRIDFECSH